MPELFLQGLNIYILISVFKHTCYPRQWHSLLQVKKLLARGNLDLAQANLEREGEVGEIKNQIAIIRYDTRTLATLSILWQMFFTNLSMSVNLFTGSAQSYGGD